MRWSKEIDDGYMISLWLKKKKIERKKYEKN